MARTYVRVEQGAVKDTFVCYVDPVTGYEYPVEELMPALDLLLYVEITGMNPAPTYDWTYDGVNFHVPVPPYIDPRPAIHAQLAEIDRDSARPLRSLIISNPDIGEGTPERAELEALELRAVELRETLDNLPPPPQIN